MTLRHPFPGLNQFRGFDVRGGFLSDGDYASAFDDSCVFANPLGNDARLLNPDGYMRWFNPTDFPIGGPPLFSYIKAKYGTSHNVLATVNPYKYFSDDFLSSASKTVLLQDMTIDPAKRGTFSSSSTVTRRYNIQFPVVSGNPVFRFTYVIDASYIEPIPGDPMFPVESFSTSGNMQEAYKVVMTDNGSSAYYIDSTDNGGNLRFNLEIFDWQSPYNPSGVAGEIGSVIVESPTLLSSYTDGMVDITDQFKNSIVASTATSSVATIDITGVTPTALDNQYLFFTVTSADPDNYSSPYNTPYPAAAKLAAYFLFKAPISDTVLNVPPTVGQVAGLTPVTAINTNEPYSAPVNDPDTGQTLTASWSVVPTGNTPIFNIPSNLDLSVNIDWSDYSPGVYDVNLQVFDGYASVSGTLLTVTYNNTPPTVGAVTGKTPVTVADTNVNYAAPVNDPDLSQTITAMWSVVPSGSPASFTIPSNGAAYSLNFNWSTYQVGNYDVNVRVNDGVAPPVTGTLLTVTLNNTAPILGAITGSVSVNEQNSASVYTAGTLTDPDNGQTHTYLWSIVPDGSAANFNLTGTGNQLTVNWCTYPIGQYDMRVRVNDGYVNALSPILDITRTLTGCGGTAHLYLNKHSEWPTFSYTDYVPDTTPPWPPAEPPLTLDGYMLPRMDIDFWRRGAFQGQGVIQAGNAVLMNFTTNTASQIQDAAPQYKWRIPGMSFYDPNWTNSIPCSPRVVTSLDTSPDLNDLDGYDDNRIVIVTSHRHDRIYVLDADKPTPTLAAQLMTTLTDVVGAREIPCIAIDENNDIWALVFTSANQYMLHHWTYILDNNSGGPYYTYEAADTITLTAQLGAQIDVFDMVVSFVNNHLYIFERGATLFGTIHDVNLNTSPPTYVTSKTNIFQSTITALTWRYQDWGTDTLMHQYCFGGDITIDHMGYEDCDPEHCRLEVMAKLNTGTMTLVRLDLNLNIINRQNSTDTNTFTCYGIATNASVGERQLVSPLYLLLNTSTLGMPYEFYYWSPPVSW